MKNSRIYFNTLIAFLRTRIKSIKSPSLKGLNLIKEVVSMYLSLGQCPKDVVHWVEYLRFF